MKGKLYALNLSFSCLLRKFFPTKQIFRLNINFRVRHVCDESLLKTWGFFSIADEESRSVFPNQRSIVKKVQYLPIFHLCKVSIAGLQDENTNFPYCSRLDVYLFFTLIGTLLCTITLPFCLCFVIVSCLLRRLWLN